MASSKEISKPEIDRFADLEKDLKNTPGQFNQEQRKAISESRKPSPSPDQSKDPDQPEELASIKKAGETEILTPEQFKERALELKRCREDILYFCRKYFKISSLGQGLITLDPYPKQEELLRFIQDNNRSIVCASRQVGKTTIYTVFLLWYAMFHSHKRVMVCGNKLDIAIEIMDRIRLGYEYCPSAIKLGVTTYSKKCIEFENGSIIRCFATSSSGCRGFSANCLVMDEAAFLPKNVADEFMASVFPILSSDVNSKAIMVSTPNGTANNLFFDTWQQATDPNYQSDEKWKAFRYLWYDVPGRDQRWKEQQIATIGMARWMQEFECEFKSSTDASLVPSDAIERYRMNLKNHPEPARLNLSKSPDREMEASFWAAFDPSRTYAASADVSEGTGNDSSVVDVWDVTSVRHLRLVARMSCAKATLVEFAEATARLLRMYAFPPFIVESNGVGSGFLDILLETYGYPKERTFHEQQVSASGKYGPISYGVKSKNRTKLEACMFLNELITTKEVDIDIPDEQLVNEMGTFVRKNTSTSITYQAKDKCHDDYIMTWIWGMYLLFPDCIQQNYVVNQAFRTSMDRVLPDSVSYLTPPDPEVVQDTMASEAHQSVVSQLGGLEDCRVVKLRPDQRSLPNDELFYGGRQWGAGRQRDFFVVNQDYDPTMCFDDEDEDGESGSAWVLTDL